ncbi:MAG: putative thiosulfate sulfurtransferase [Methanomassiliicoccales archaeon PtaU1.Bin124]|nr:MAG: putative thiosulfate sulfurtransferase [Methanomassiliicoccales archaeon PtaU1.Bin124]
MIIDCQPWVNNYISGHIPGAVHAEECMMRMSHFGRPGVLAPTEIVEMSLRHLGLKAGDPVVVYGADGAIKKVGDGVEQFFFAYALARYGHEDIIMLDGGMQAWTEAGGQLESTLPRRLAGDFQAWLRQDLQIEMEELREIKDHGETVLIDTRPKKQYAEQAYWPKPGHIPGAINIPWTEMVTKENPRLFRPKKELKEIFQKNRVEKDKEVLLTCGTGRSASVAFIALTSLLEYPMVRMYEGSFTEWSAHTENTTVKGNQPY